MTEKPPYLLTRRPLAQYFVHVSLLILITASVFSNTLDNTYHLDSVYRIERNTEIDQFWPPARFFTDLRTGSSIPQIADYRPMMPLSHAINSEISKATGTSRLAGFHVGNIAIHICSAILLYFLSLSLISSWGTVARDPGPAVHPSQPAFAAALIFAVHPISGSAVNYIAGRDLLLMVFFFMSSMLVYASMRRKGDTLSGWLISLLLLSFAILSKQVAIMGFGLVFLFEWILMREKLSSWKLWARTFLFSIPTAGYFLFRWLWTAGKNPHDPLRVPEDFLYPLTMAKAHVFYYLKNFVWPFEMRALAKFDLVESPLDPGTLAGIIFILGTLVLAWYLRKRKPLITFAILAYWWLFSLTASIFPFRYVVTDYRQYLPLSFLCLIVGLVLFSFRPRALSVFLLAGLTAYFSVSSYQINKHWKTEESFWRQSVRYGAVALAHSNYGLVMTKKDEELAEQHFREALSQDPLHIYANINLGMLYIHQEKTREGLGILENMVALNPEWALAHYWLYRGLNAAGQPRESLEELKQAADLDPRNLQYQYEAALALQQNNNEEESIAYLERLVDINDRYEDAGFLLGFAYQKAGDDRRAISQYRRFLDFQPEHVQARFNYAYALMKQDECDAAIEQFHKVLSLRPQYRESHLHLSNCYRKMGNEALAEEHGIRYQD